MSSIMSYVTSGMRAAGVGFMGGAFCNAITQAVEGRQTSNGIAGVVNSSVSRYALGLIVAQVAREVIEAMALEYGMTETELIPLMCFSVLPSTSKESPFADILLAIGMYKTLSIPAPVSTSGECLVPIEPSRIVELLKSIGLVSGGIASRACQIIPASRVATLSTLMTCTLNRLGFWSKVSTHFFNIVTEKVVLLEAKGQEAENEKPDPAPKGKKPRGRSSSRRRK